MIGYTSRWLSSSCVSATENRGGDAGASSNSMALKSKWERVAAGKLGCFISCSNAPLAALPSFSAWQKCVTLSICLAASQPVCTWCIEDYMQAT